MSQIVGTTLAQKLKPGHLFPPNSVRPALALLREISGSLLAPEFQSTTLERASTMGSALRAIILRKLEKAVAVRNSLLEKFSGNFRRCWKIIHRFSGSTKCYPCQGLGIFRQDKWLLENRPPLRERSWVFSSGTVATFLGFADIRGHERYPKNFC